MIGFNYYSLKRLSGYDWFYLLFFKETVDVISNFKLLNVVFPIFCVCIQAAERKKLTNFHYKIEKHFFHCYMQIKDLKSVMSFYLKAGRLKFSSLNQILPHCEEWKTKS